jgi:TetR/AcrR family transcriptional regulator, tetracycline repressor protein
MSLDRAAIVDAALALLDREGVDGLSTRKLAADLGIRGPSLYWHFKNKRELLDHMAERMLHSALPAPPVALTPGFDRRAWLEAGARGIRKVALSRRDGALVLAGSRPVTDGGAISWGKFVATLQQTGLTAQDSIKALQVLGRFAVGWVLYEQAGGRGLEDSEAGFEFGLQSLLDGVENSMATQFSPEIRTA